ncbi:MAG: phosphatidylinositol-specific phospholipase C domain-containing protein [Planctomycetes bacterium]|nr:phosphatidylinositol-specific phospholipase C domain-containing protein [Planctomycetota bacterium]
MGPLCTTLLTLISLTPAQQDEAKVDRESWVEELFQAQPETRLVDLILPGTHDSGSYAITSSSPPAPGAPAAYERVGSIAAKWSKTQDQTLEQQLRGGIRYLDLRVAHFEGRLVLVHGLVSCDLDEALAGVGRFAAEHPKEPVLLDLQAMPPRSAHPKLHELLQETLGDHLFQGEDPPAKWTLKELWSSERALICIASHSDFAARRPEYYSRKLLDSVWTNTREVPALREGLDARLRARDPNGLQCAYLTFTPKARTIITGSVFGGKGLRSLSKPLFKLPGEWIPEWLEAGLRPNVVSVDFYEHTDVVDAVILGNKTLFAR